MASKTDVGKSSRAKSATTASSSSQPQLLNGYLDPLTAIPDAYRPRWKLLWEKVRNKRQDEVEQVVKERGIRLTERNLKEFFNPEHEPEADFEIEETSRESEEEKRKSRVHNWIQGLP